MVCTSSDAEAPREANDCVLADVCAGRSLAQVRAVLHDHRPAQGSLLEAPQPTLDMRIAAPGSPIAYDMPPGEIMQVLADDEPPPDVGQFPAAHLVLRQALEEPTGVSGPSSG